MHRMRQDDSAHMPLALFLDGTLVATVPPEDSYGHATRSQTAQAMGMPEAAFEVLLPCHLHPTVSAVDCLDCEPI